VPVAQTFEIVPEVDAYPDVDRFKNLKKEVRYSWSPLALWLRYKIGYTDVKAIIALAQKGFAAINEAHLDFGEPVLIDGQTDARKLAQDLRGNYESMTRVTTPSLVATVLRGLEDWRYPAYHKLCDETEKLVEKLSSVAPLGNFVQENRGTTRGIEDIVARGVAGLNAGKVVALQKLGYGYEFNPHVIHRVDYYANTIRHFLDEKKEK